MATYEFGRIARLDMNLREQGVPEDVTAAIMQGGEEIRSNSKPRVKGAWFQQAMIRMDELLDKETRRAVREGCACCLGGERHKIAKSIARKHADFDERISAANEAKRVFGHSVTKQDDGRILVCFDEEGKPSYHCVCLGRDVSGPISATYCMCCGGHIKHHLQTVLERKLECEVRSTALTSAGATPCSFLYRVVE